METTEKILFCRCLRRNLNKLEQLLVIRKTEIVNGITTSKLVEEWRVIPGRGRIDWSTVDWSKQNVDISRELECSYSSVSIARRKLGKSTVTRLSRLPWSTVDWSKPNGVIASELGTHAGSVQQWRRKLGQAPQTIRNWSSLRRISEEQIKTALWELKTDAMIGKEWRVSRERVHQIRQENKLPECKWRNKHTVWIEFAIWVETHRGELKYLPASKILDMSPNTGLSRQGKRDALRSLGFVVANYINKQIYPWDKMNWDLPNIPLELIWGTHKNQLANGRCKSRRPSTKWRIGGFFASAFLDDPEFHAALAAEIQKATSLGFKPDLNKIDDWLEYRRANLPHHAKETTVSP